LIPSGPAMLSFVLLSILASYTFPILIGAHLRLDPLYILRLSIEQLFNDYDDLPDEVGALCEVFFCLYTPLLFFTLFRLFWLVYLLPTGGFFRLPGKPLVFLVAVTIAILSDFLIMYCLWYPGLLELAISLSATGWVAHRFRPYWSSS